jgi:hypothetical protein
MNVLNKWEAIFHSLLVIFGYRKKYIYEGQSTSFIKTSDVTAKVRNLPRFYYISEGRSLHLSFVTQKEQTNSESRGSIVTVSASQ